MLEQLKDELDKLIALHARMIRRQIDACSMQASSDWSRARAAEIAYEEAKDAYHGLLKKAVASAAVAGISFGRAA